MLQQSEMDKVSKNGTAERQRGRACPYVCVLMWGKKPDKEHADPQSWLQSSPDESVLRHTVMYPRAGSAEAATRTKAEPPDKSGYQQTKGDLLMHDMGLQTNVFVLHSMSCIMLCESESHSFCNWTLIFCRMCFSSQIQIQDMTRVQTCAQLNWQQCQQLFPVKAHSVHPFFDDFIIVGTVQQYADALLVLAG